MTTQPDKQELFSNQTATTVGHSYFKPLVNGAPFQLVRPSDEEKCIENTRAGVLQTHASSKHTVVVDKYSPGINQHNPVRVVGVFFFFLQQQQQQQQQLSLEV